jgi:hypothetical protein
VAASIPVTQESTHHLHSVTIDQSFAGLNYVLSHRSHNRIHEIVTIVNLDDAMLNVLNRDTQLLHYQLRATHLIHDAKQTLQLVRMCAFVIVE